MLLYYIAVIIAATRLRVLAGCAEGGALAAGQAADPYFDTVHQSILYYTIPYHTILCYTILKYA